MTYKIQPIKLMVVKDGRPMRSPVGSVSSSADAVSIVRRYLDGVDREHFIVLCLDAKHQVSAIHTVGIGSLTMSVVHPREVFKVALLSNAAAIVMAHNHPSGDASPSEEDRELTKRLVLAGELMGVTVLDHVIIGDRTNNYKSFADNRWLK